jgi:PHD/YefM family antitoxin component YafN of YafNO toxin-antitoxin module
MPERIYSISEIRETITRLPEQFEEDLDVVTVTRHGRPVMTILPTATYRALVEAVAALEETLEIVQDEELMAAFRQGVQGLAEGKGRPWEDVKRELNLE